MRTYNPKYFHQMTTPPRFSINVSLRSLRAIKLSRTMTEGMMSANSVAEEKIMLEQIYALYYVPCVLFQDISVRKSLLKSFYGTYRTTESQNNA